MVDRAGWGGPLWARETCAWLCTACLRPPAWLGLIEAGQQATGLVGGTLYGKPVLAIGPAGQPQVPFSGDSDSAYTSRVMFGPARHGQAPHEAPFPTRNDCRSGS